MNTLEFEHAKIKHNITNKINIKVKTYTIISLLIITYLFLYSLLLCHNKFFIIFETKQQITCTFLFSGIFLFGLINIFYYILNNIKPKEYDFINKLKNLKEDEITLNFANKNIIINTFEKSGWVSQDLTKFLPRNLEYTIKEDFKNPKYLYLNLDFTQNPVLVSIKEKK